MRIEMCPGIEVDLTEPDETTAREPWLVCTVVLDHVMACDEHVLMWFARTDDKDQDGATLTPAEARQLGQELIARADFIDNHRKACAKEIHDA